MLDSDTKRRLRSAVTAASGVGGSGCLAHLREALKAEAVGKAEIALEQTEVRFDTIPRVALEEVRKAYLAILDDPTALEALKRELTA